MKKNFLNFNILYIIMFIIIIPVILIIIMSLIDIVIKTVIKIFTLLLFLVGLLKIKDLITNTIIKYEYNIKRGLLFILVPFILYLIKWVFRYLELLEYKPDINTVIFLVLLGFIGKFLKNVIQYFNKNT